MIKVNHITKSFGNIKTFDDFTMEIPDRKITVILGPSGCGKSTFLNILADLVEIDKGNVIVTKDIGYLFQEPRLLPWLTIRQNINLVLRDKMPAVEVEKRIKDNLEATGLLDYADSYPSQLSGGMLQRAAMARAFSYDASLLLMDEPFKSLDLKTRYQLLTDFLAIWLKKPRTVIMVTHDPQEAVKLGDKIVIFPNKPIHKSQEIIIDIPQAEREIDGKLFEIEKELISILLQF